MVRDALPSGRFVVRFEFRAARPPRAWLVCEGATPTVCHDDPRFEVDLVVSSDVPTLHRIFAGRVALSAALRDGSLTLDGSAEERRRFTRWFGLSPFAPAARAM